jgi:hypothetical protein
MRAVLIPHPSSPAGPIEGLTVEVERQGESLWLRFVVQGAVDQVAWPAPATPGRADELWRRTCFEAFVATEAGYVEYNLSPSGQWATYGFDAYRAGMRPADREARVLGLDGASGYAALEARIDLPADAGRLGLSAVIETTEGVVAYWALAHPSDKPDFHHPETMTLALPAAEPL